jgi:hypothetical protein
MAGYIGGGVSGQPGLQGVGEEGRGVPCEAPGEVSWHPTRESIGPYMKRVSNRDFFYQCADFS